jgi:hypothetical protein
VSDDQPTQDLETAAPVGDPGSSPRYEIRVKGRIAACWSAWFDGLDVVASADGTTVISGPVVDQAALHGLLQKVRDVGIPLLSLTELPDRTAGEPASPNPHGEPT